MGQGTSKFKREKTCPLSLAPCPFSLVPKLSIPSAATVAIIFQVSKVFNRSRLATRPVRISRPIIIARAVVSLGLIVARRAWRIPFEQRAMTDIYSALVVNLGDFDFELIADLNRVFNCRYSLIGQLRNMAHAFLAD